MRLLNSLNIGKLENDITMILRLFRPIHLEWKKWSSEGLDNFLDTSHDAETYHKGPQTVLEQNPTSKLSSRFSSYMIIIHDHHTSSSYLTIIHNHHTWSSYMIIIYDHHIWSSYMIIIYDHHIWWSYMIVIYDDHLRW